MSKVTLNSALKEDLNDTNSKASSSLALNDKAGLTRRFFDSFKRAETVCSSAKDQDLEAVNMKKSIKSRHLLMISLGTGIGTGLLVGNSTVLREAGPGGIMIGYIVASIMLYCIIQAAGELGITYSNLTGNFTAYSSFLVDPALGFAVSWVYCIQWMTVYPLQLVTASILIKFWTDKINPDVFVAIFFFLTVLINLFGAKGYVEAEFIFNCIKFLMIIGFVFLAILINVGAAGNDGYIGFRYWSNPGTFSNGFKGVCSVFCYAAFAYGGIEVMVLSASEQENPRKSIPSACKKVIYRILLLYLLTTLLVCFLVPYTHPRLVTQGTSTRQSPFVIAVELHGISVVGHFINAVILIAVLSVGNSALYSAPRLLFSLTKQGYAPKCFGYVDRQGRPLMCFLVAMAFGSIAFIACSSAQSDVFDWLLSISGLSQMFIWISICLSHIRFRDALHAQGISLNEVGYKSQTGYFGSWFSVATAVFILVSQFWVALFPVSLNGKSSLTSFLKSYLAAPILLVVYLGYKIYKKDWRLVIPAKEVDLVSHRKVFNEHELKLEDEEWKLKIKQSSFLVRMYHFWC